MVTDAMGPGVIRVERHATGGTTLNRNEQSVIAGVAFSGYSGDITIIFSIPMDFRTSHHQSMYTGDSMARRNSS